MRHFWSQHRAMLSLMTLMTLMTFRTSYRTKRFSFLDLRRLTSSLVDRNDFCLYLGSRENPGSTGQSGQYVKSFERSKQSIM